MKSKIFLLNYFIFNSELGKKEGEEQKRIVYFYPGTTSIDEKIRIIGLCEAIIKFTTNFSTHPCHVMHTQKTRQLYFTPEKDYVVCMTLRVPYSEKADSSGATVQEFHEDDIQDDTYKAILQQSYSMFKLFMGSFSYIVELSNIQGLQQRCEHFFSRYLLTLKLDNCDILDVHFGMAFLPLDKFSYLKVQSFVNLLEATFSKILFSAFLYNDQLVWSGLEQGDMRVLYKYLVSSLFPATFEQDFQVVSVTEEGHYGRYLTGPAHQSPEKERESVKVPRVYVENCATRSTQECHLVVYRALSATICLLLDGSEKLTPEVFTNLDTFLGVRLSNLASYISEQYAKRPSSSSQNEGQFKYVYFNKMNLATKSTIHSETKRASGISLDVLRIMTDVNGDLNCPNAQNVESEVIMKTTGDYWVVGKRADHRQVYVLLNNKHANLIEISEEVKKISSTLFNNIFVD